MTWPVFAGPPAPSVGSPWPAVSLAVGSLGLVLAVIPHGVGLIGLAAGGFGVAAGTIGVLLRGRRRVVLAASGIVVSVLAVGMAAIMTVGYPGFADRARPSAAADTNRTRTVLARELDVQIGAFDYTPAPNRFSDPPTRLMVTLTNKRNVARQFFLTIAGFENERVQIDTFQVDATLDANATRQVNAADRSSRLSGISENTGQRLRAATFAVLSASSTPPDRP